MGWKKYFKKFVTIFLVIFVITILLGFLFIHLTMSPNWCGAIGGSCDPINPPLKFYIENLLNLEFISFLILVSFVVTFIYVLISSKKSKK